jgi:DNA-binding transcriptional MerR regulator
MALNTDKNTKLYYSIKEVAQLIGVSESTLRYWETEFPSIRPRTVSSTKVRQYTEKDVEQLRVIYSLLKVRGFKIAAARKYMRENRQSVDKSSAVLETLAGVRAELKALRDQLDGLV